MRRLPRKISQYITGYDVTTNPSNSITMKICFGLINYCKVIVEFKHAPDPFQPSSKYWTLLISSDISFTHLTITSFRPDSLNMSIGRLPPIRPHSRSIGIIHRHIMLERKLI